MTQLGATNCLGMTEVSSSAGNSNEYMLFLLADQYVLQVPLVVRVTSHAYISHYGKAPPVDPFTVDDVKTAFDDWLLKLE